MQCSAYITCYMHTSALHMMYALLEYYIMHTNIRFALPSAPPPHLSSQRTAHGPHNPKGRGLIMLTDQTYFLHNHADLRP